jgi:hypothetical protein
MTMSIYDLPELGDKPKVLPCPVCGRTAFREGKLAGHAPVWLTGASEQPNRLFAAEPATRARVCTHCGNVQIFVGLE